MSKGEAPKRAVLFVLTVLYGQYREVVAEKTCDGNRQYFLTSDSQDVHEGELVVLERTEENPKWWDPRTFDRQTYLWRVVKEDNNE